MRISVEHRVLFLPDDPAEGIRVLDACPNRPFRPFALLVWGAKADTFIRQLRVAGEAQLTGPMPAFEFESDIAFDYFRCLCIARSDLLMPAIESLRDVGIFHRLHMPAIEADGRVELTLEGPLEHAALLGDVPRLREDA